MFRGVGDVDRRESLGSGGVRTVGREHKRNSNVAVNKQCRGKKVAQCSMSNVHSTYKKSLTKRQGNTRTSNPGNGARSWGGLTDETIDREDEFGRSGESRFLAWEAKQIARGAFHSETEV